MNAKQNNKDEIYVLEFLVPQLFTARFWDIGVKEQMLLQ